MQVERVSKALMIRLVRAAVFTLVALAAATTLMAQDAAMPRTTPIRIFVDCGFFCDEDFLKREITFVDYMRDRRDADVHVLVTTRDTGGGGTDCTLKFIGLGPFAGVEQTLRYAAPTTATADERRKGLAEVIKQGLVRYVSESPQSQRLKITFTPESGEAKPDAKKDPWNLWVFRTNVGGSFNGEQSTKSHSIRGSATANRTTEDWRLSFSANTNYRTETFQLPDPGHGIPVLIEEKEISSATAKPRIDDVVENRSRRDPGSDRSETRTTIRG